MTCAHVLGLIDAGALADYPRARIDAAWQHARGCPECGRALEAAAALTSDLAGLPVLEPPSRLGASVMARIAQLEHTRLDEMTVSAPAPGARSVLSEWATVVSAIGASAVAFVLGLAMTGEGTGSSTALPGGGMAGMIPVPPEALVVSAGLLVYVIGLFAPLWSANQS
jgi:hypothetical protein